MPDIQLNAAELYQHIVDPRSINQILRDGGIDDAGMVRFWAKIGIPIEPGVRQSLSLTDLIVRLGAVASYPDHPFGKEIDGESFTAFLLRQGLSEREGALVLTRMGWNLGMTARKKIASIITRMAKTIARPDMIQG